MRKVRLACANGHGQPSTLRCVKLALAVEKEREREGIARVTAGQRASEKDRERERGGKTRPVRVLRFRHISRPETAGRSQRW